MRSVQFSLSRVVILTTATFTPLMVAALVYVHPVKSREWFQYLFIAVIPIFICLGGGRFTDFLEKIPFGSPGIRKLVCAWLVACVVFAFGFGAIYTCPSRLLARNPILTSASRTAYQIAVITWFVSLLLIVFRAAVNHAAGRTNILRRMMRTMAGAGVLLIWLWLALFMYGQMPKAFAYAFVSCCVAAYSCLVFMARLPKSAIWLTYCASALSVAVAVDHLIAFDANRQKDVVGNLSRLLTMTWPKSGISSTIWLAIIGVSLIIATLHFGQPHAKPQSQS